MKNYVSLQKYLKTDDEAYDEVKRGKAWGALVFSDNYTDALVDRVENTRFAEDGSIESSEINIRLDMSSKFEVYIMPCQVYEMNVFQRIFYTRCELEYFLITE